MTNDPNYREPRVTTTKDTSGGIPSWLKYLLIALAALLLLWALFELFDNDADVATVPATDTDAVIVETEPATGTTDTETVPVAPVE